MVSMVDPQREGRQLHRYRSRIAELKAALDEKWIPLTERLPDDDITVLVAVKDVDEPVWLAYHDEHGWFSATDGVPLTALVTHWRQMPEGPNG